jgi:hypothetical protein
MNAATRRVYFTQVWPGAAKGLGCDPRGDDARRAVTREAMRLVGGPDTDSITGLGADEITALFAYCRWLARKDDLRLLSAWTSCQEDYRTYNRSLQGDHYRRRAGYAKGGRMDRDRFAGHPHDGLYDESRMSPEEAEQYLMTMRARARGKGRKARKPRRPVRAAAAAAMDDNCPF